MRSKRNRNRSQQALPTIQAAFAFADVLVEATRRGLCRGSSPTMAGVAPERASGEIFVILGRNLRRQLRRMLVADDRYQELKARQRWRRTRRDEIAARGHALLVDVRKYLQGFFGWDGACEILGLFGPTEREPSALHRQLGEAVWWARNWDNMPEPLVAGGEDEAEKCVTRLEELYEELDQAVDDVGRGAREVEVAMLDQRVAMEALDRAYKHSAGAMEAQLIQVGLPTLAAAVRPGVGRRGRPLKTRPIDLYPDLVEQVRACGLIDLDVAESSDVRNGATDLVVGSQEVGDGSPRDVGSPDTAGYQDEADRTVSAGTRNGSALDGESQQAVLERSADDEIIEQPLHKRAEAEEKSAHRFHERSESDDKSQQRFHERPGGDEIIEQPLHKSTAGETSSLFSRLNVPPTVVTCGQDPRRRDLRRRPGGPGAGRSSLERVRQAKSSWWQRLLRVA